MDRKLWIANAFAAAALTACAQSVDKNKAVEDVLTDAHGVAAAINAHNPAKAVAHDAPGVVVMYHGVPNTYGADADLANLKQLLAASPAAHVDVGGEAVDMAASGDLAVYRANYVFSHTDPKTARPVAERGNWLFGYKLINGAWKIVWSVTSDTGS
jgi:ketosteroid isomerase-like protein